MEKAYLNIVELSEYLNVKPSTLYLKVASGDLPHYRVGRLIRFRKDEIDTWMDRHRNQSNAHIESKMIRRRTNPKTVDVHGIVKKTIEDVRGKMYTPVIGKPDQKLKGLETKEV